MWMRVVILTLVQAVVSIPAFKQTVTTTYFTNRHTDKQTHTHTRKNKNKRERDVGRKIVKLEIQRQDISR